MRVAHLTTVHHPLDPRIYMKEARSLARAGYDVWLLAKDAGGVALEGVRFVPLSPPGSSKSDRLRRQVAADREIRRLQPDLLHVHDPELIPLAYRFKQRTGGLVVYDKHEDYRSGRGAAGQILAGLEQWAYGWVDRVILAEQAYADAPELQRVGATVVLNYALPVESVGLPHEAVRANDGRMRLVYAGTVARSRGLFHMLDLVSAARDRGMGVDLEIVGICNYAEQRREAESVIKSRSLKDAIRLVGWQQYADPSEIRAALMRADVGLMLADPEPNYVISIPTKFYEYMQYGLPMLVSDFPLWSGFVEKTGCGRTVDPSRSTAVLDQLLALQGEIVDASVRDSIRIKARDYHWSHMERRLLSVYRDLSASTP